MSKRMWSGVLASIVCSAVAVAVAQDPPKAPSAAAMGKSMTVTGCIQRADMPPAGATGTAATPATPANPATPAASAADQTKYVLKNVSWDPASSSTAGTAGTTGAASAMGAMATEYRLDGDDAKLSPHVGHKVEITGTAAKPAMAAQPSTPSAAASPKLKVDSVKMISATCP